MTDSAYAEDNTLLLYMKEINKIPLLQQEEEEKIARQAAKGNKSAAEKLINANLRFVIMIAKKFQGKGLPLEDLIGEGNIGLMNAVKHYDVERGFRFITYAVWWIRQSIIKALQEKGRMIRLPSNKNNELAKIEKARQVLTSAHAGKSETELMEVATFLDMTMEKAVDLISISQDVISLDEPVTNFENAMTLKDFIEDDLHHSPVENALNSILRDEVESVLSKLENREADVIRSRFGLGNTSSLTLKEIGDRYNLSREWVRQIEKRALGQLQKSSRHKRLESYIA